MKSDETKARAVGLYDAAKLLSCHRDTVLRRVRSKRIKGVKLGRRWLVSLEEIERVIREGAK